MSNSTDHPPDCRDARTLIDDPSSVAPQRSRDQVQGNVQHVADCSPCMDYATRDGHGPAFEKLLVVSDIHHDTNETV